MQISTINAKDIKNYQVSKGQQNKTNTQNLNNVNSYKIGALEALAFKGTGFYDDMQMCKNMLEAATVLVPGELKQRFNLEARNSILSQLKNFSTEGKKSNILMSLLNIRAYNKQGRELSKIDINNYLKLVSGMPVAEQFVVLDILETEVRNHTSYDENERSALVFDPIRKNPKALATLVRVKKEMNERGVDIQLRNDVLGWVFAFIKNDEKPYVEDNSLLITKKLQDSNLKLAPAIDCIVEHCDEEEFNKILPILTEENMGEILDNDDFISQAKWRRTEAAENFIEKHQK